MSESKLRILNRLAKDNGGSQIAEAALVLPIVFLLLFGIMSFARAYNIYTTITYAAQEGARVANSSSCATCGNAAATGQDVANRVEDVLKASHIDTSQIQSYPGTTALNFCSGNAASNCSTQDGVYSCTNVEINATTRRVRRGRTVTSVTGPTACGATVSFQYPFKFQMPFVSLNSQSILLTADVQMQAED